MKDMRHGANEPYGNLISDFFIKRNITTYEIKIQITQRIMKKSNAKKGRGDFHPLFCSNIS